MVVNRNRRADEIGKFTPKLPKLSPINARAFQTLIGARLIFLPDSLIENQFIHSALSIGGSVI